MNYETPRVRYKDHKTKYKEEIINMLLYVSEKIPCKTLVDCFNPIDFTHDVLYKDRRGNLWWTNKLAPTEYFPYRRLPTVVNGDSPVFDFTNQEKFISKLAESAKDLPNGTEISTNLITGERLHIYKKNNVISFRVASRGKKGIRRKPISFS